LENTEMDTPNSTTPRTLTAAERSEKTAFVTARLNQTEMLLDEVRSLAVAMAASEDDSSARNGCMALVRLIDPVLDQVRTAQGEIAAILSDDRARRSLSTSDSEPTPIQGNQGGDQAAAAPKTTASSHLELEAPLRQALGMASCLWSALSEHGEPVMAGAAEALTVNLIEINDQFHEVQNGLAE
jgi:hypothetical protein